MPFNFVIAGIIIVSVLVVSRSVWLVVKDIIPPKSPKEKDDPPVRRCGFKYSLKEDIDKRREEISNHKF